MSCGRNHPYAALVGVPVGAPLIFRRRSPFVRAEFEARFGVICSHILCRIAHPANSRGDPFFSANNIILAAMCGHQSFRSNGVVLRTNHQPAGMSDVSARRSNTQHAGNIFQILKILSCPCSGAWLLKCHNTIVDCIHPCVQYGKSRSMLFTK